ncbi:MAG: hypothetical protein V4520_00965 [Bacteroidota bacterium]
MKKTFLALTILLTLLTTSQISFAQVANYYGTAESINFNGIDFNLAWSSHPNANYYKHEYIPKGENSEHFKNMLMLDFIKGDFKLKDAVQLQIDKIQERKKTDAVANYDLVESPDGKEFILDFLMSTTKDNKVNLVEWSAYHYKSYTDKAGHTGVLLFAISHRAYDNDVDTFLKSLTEYRMENRKALIKFPMPEIQIK